MVLSKAIALIFLQQKGTPNLEYSTTEQICLWIFEF